ncbi:MAG: hypothetical protein N2Z79_01105, partial [Candidatus Omnitrophica bacterium]|nr:hypothetical protein [Candidatus Omnitrophota bacterium]
LDIIVAYEVNTQICSEKVSSFIFYLKDTKNKRRVCSDLIRVGLIKIPFFLDLKFFKGLPNNLVPAELAETILLAKENNFVNYSLDQNTNPEKLEEIADLLAKNRFEIWAPYAPIN